jgi:ATPase family AAA domain-containing protein 3A/B
MAKSIGMDYALMSGRDVGPLGNDAVTQIHNLFRWARFSNKGGLLFIDEAECFLGDRSNKSMSETAHNSLNELLYNTGTERTDFMIILATNRAEDLDPAVLDRCDKSLLFPLPDSACRRKLLTDYFLEYVHPMEEGTRRCEPKNRIVATLQNLFLTQDPFQATIEDEVMNTEGLNTQYKGMS